MEEKKQQKKHEDFLWRSVIYIALSFFTSLFELGFNAVSVRLPDGNYDTFWALIKLFFIITAPLVAIQLVVSKEVASYGVLDKHGKRRSFVMLTGKYSLFVALGIILVGFAFSSIIANSLDMENNLPVYILFIAIGVYFPVPILCGVIQGLKRFYWLAAAQMSWGGFRLVAAVIIVLWFSLGMVHLLLGIMAATIGTLVVSLLFVRSIFSHPPEKLEREELVRAYSFIIPVIVTLFSVTTMKNVDVVFAKSFFPDSAKAYTCAALVGSAFYTLTGIFMVMFPIVSEEKTRGRNPIMFLINSCVFVSVLSFIGIGVAMIWPHIPMYIINIGIAIPGAEPLIRVIGLAILPISLVAIISNYFLAKHEWRFIPILAGGMILQLLFIIFNHGTPMKMLIGIMIANTVTFVCLLLYLIIEHRQYIETAYSDQVKR